MRGVKISPAPTSRSLVVCLTSYGNDKRPATGFEWEGVTSTVEAHRIFLRDQMQHWYLGPILDFSSSLQETVSKISGYIEEHQIDKVALIGSSMGGYGAMLIGSLLSADLVMAFAPQTCLYHQFMEKIHDARWEWKMSEIASIGYEHRDIRALFRTTPPKRSMIFYDPTFPVDWQHAHHLEGIPGVELHEADGGHHVATPLAKAGEITRRLREFEDQLPVDNTRRIPQM